MVEQYKQELAAVRAGILKLETELEVQRSVSSPNGGSVSSTLIDIAKLHARERELITLIAELARIGSGFGELNLSYGVYCGG